MNKNVTAIMCALPEELEAIKQVFQFHKLSKSVDHPNIWHASDNHSNYIIGVSHIGCINATITASKICIQHQPRHIIFCGIAGGICNTLNIGDVVIPNRAFYVESESHKSFANLWTAPNPDLNLPSINIDKFKLNNHKISQASVATSDVFPAPEKSLAACHSKNATIIDMETYPCAFVAKQFNIPFYCVRSVSNAITTDEIPDNALSLSAKNAAAVTLQLLSHLNENNDANTQSDY